MSFDNRKGPGVERKSKSKSKNLKLKHASLPMVPKTCSEVQVCPSKRQQEQFGGEAYPD